VTRLYRTKVALPEIFAPAGTVLVVEDGSPYVAVIQRVSADHQGLRALEDAGAIEPLPGASPLPSGVRGQLRRAGFLPTSAERPMLELVLGGAR
jgi:hypothetical protein